MFDDTHNYFRFKKSLILFFLLIGSALIGIIMGIITFIREKYNFFIFFSLPMILTLTILLILVNRKSELEVNFKFKKIYCSIHYKKQLEWNICFEQLKDIQEKNHKLYLYCESEKEMIIPLKLFSKKQILQIKEDLNKAIWEKNYGK